MSNSLSAAHISADLSSYEAARSGFFSFIVDFKDDDKLLSAAFDTSNTAEPGDTDYITKAQEGIKLNVVQANVPHFSLAKLTYRRGNDVVNFAGMPEFPDGEITVDDVVGIDTKSILMAWQGLAYDVHTRKGGKMTAYKRDCTLVEYSQDFEEIRSWDLKGCWIQNITEDAFNKEQDGARKIRATIVYDRAIMKMPTKTEAE